MYKKIYRNMRFIALFTLVISTIFTLSVSYTTFTSSLKSEVKTATLFLADILNDSSDFSSVLPAGLSDMRITLISPDGEVVSDNSAGAAGLENHSNRPEIIAAEQNGSGEQTRYSSTLGAMVYYCAVRLDNGYIIRVAAPVHKPLVTFVSVVIPFLIVAFFIYFLSVTIAVRLTENIIKPIENAYYFNREDYDDVYEEIQPFLKRIAEQNKRIRKNIAELKRAEQIRREFSANVSHELKTPLTAIKGYSQIINNGIAKPEDIPKFTKKIEDEASRLIVLISDIIKLSNLDEEGSCQKEDVKLLGAAEECAERLRDRAAERRITINVSGDNSIIRANSVQVDEMLCNLIDNAVKYNKDGGKVDVTVKGGSISVADTGIGIEQEDIGRIFERFFRADKSHCAKIGGTGLGLSIVKHIALINGARVSVDSTPGEGSIFTVSFDNKFV
ncbi:MAG: ATP-binding protein [Clostridiales bacterium]|nr:ATP-binding protein [Clostridiales bacterium]